jgi:hypothetical protein
MGWGIIIPEVYLSRVKISELEDEQERLIQDIRGYKEALLVLAASTPINMKYDNGDEMPWIEYIHIRTNEILQDLEVDMRKLQLIQLALDNKSEITED